MKQQDIDRLIGKVKKAMKRFYGDKFSEIEKAELHVKMKDEPKGIAGVQFDILNEQE